MQPTLGRRLLAVLIGFVVMGLFVAAADQMFGGPAAARIGGESASSARTLLEILLLFTTVGGLIGGYVAGLFARGGEQQVVAWLAALVLVAGCLATFAWKPGAPLWWKIGNVVLPPIFVLSAGKIVAKRNRRP